MPTIQDVCAQLQSYISQLDGIRAAPALPPEAQVSGLESICYPPKGHWTSLSSGWKKGLHEVFIEISIPRLDISKEMNILEPFIELVPNLLIRQFDPNLGGDKWGGLVDSFGYNGTTATGIDYEFLVVPWPDEEHQRAMYRFTVHDVKMQTAVT